MGIATYSYNRSTSGGEIIRELVNASDGQGLHFDGAGSIDIATPPDLGTKFSFEFIIQADSWADSTYKYLIDFGPPTTGGRFIFGTSNGAGDKLAVYDNTSWKTFGVSPLDDLKVHHLVVTVDGTAAILYDNGNQVGTATIASHDIDNCTDAKIGANNDGGGQWFNGTIYRARLWNKTLTSAEVTASYENATVPFADQYGSQTEVIDSRFTTGLSGWDTSNNWNSQTNPSNNMVLAASAATQVCRTGTTLTAGKRYRCTYTATSITDAPKFVFWETASTYPPITADTGSSTITAGTNSFEFVWPAASGNDYFYIQSGTTTAAVTLDDIFVWEIGCVADYDLAFANQKQSLVVEDRSGSSDTGVNATGMMSASGVTQVTPIEQLNSKSARIGTSAATPADGTVKIGDALTLSGPTTYGFVEGGSAGLILSNNSGNDCRILVNDDNTLQLNTSSTPRLTISSTGLATFSGDLTLTNSGTAIIGGASDGYVYLGNSNSQAYVQTNGSSKAALPNSVLIGAGGVGNIAVVSSTGLAVTGAVTATGNVGVGGSPTSPSSLARYLYVGDTSSAGIVLDDTNSTPWEIYNIQGSLYFAPNGGTAEVTFASSGLATFSNGIAFQSATTGSGTGTGYTLDSYEVGTFAPVVADAGTGGNAASAGAANGRYTKVGNRVYCQVSIINITTTGLTAGNIVYVRGLPFTSISTGNFYSPVEVFQGAMTSTEGVIHGLIHPNTDYMSMYNSISGAAGSTLASVSQITSGSGDMYMSFQYETAL